jgi:hypothetical protein
MTHPIPIRHRRNVPALAANLKSEISDSTSPRWPWLLLLLCLIVSAAGSDIKLAWNESATPGVTNYVLYANRGTNSIRLNVGTNLTAQVESLQPGLWAFHVTAQKGYVESSPSEPMLVEVPEPPVNMRTIAIQYSGTLSNFYDVGFFRLRLE